LAFSGSVSGIVLGCSVDGFGTPSTVFDELLEVDVLDAADPVAEPASSEPHAETSDTLNAKAANTAAMRTFLMTSSPWTLARIPTKMTRHGAAARPHRHCGNAAHSP
jgi:hypothetical protein